jgi:hypothetical protein
MTNILSTLNDVSPNLFPDRSLFGLNIEHALMYTVLSKSFDTFVYACFSVVCDT